MAKKKPINPFYVALVLIGIVFVVTATAYFVMTVQKLEPEEVSEAVEGKGSGLIGFLDRYGFQTMMIELACLAAATFAAIVLDEYRDRRSNTRSQRGQNDEEAADSAAVSQTAASQTAGKQIETEDPHDESQ